MEYCPGTNCSISLSQSTTSSISFEEKSISPPPSPNEQDTLAHDAAITLLEVRKRLEEKLAAIALMQLSSHTLQESDHK